MAIPRKSPRKSPRKAPAESPLKSLKKTLRERLKGALRITLLGIGSRLRGDDAAGLLVAETLLKWPALKETPPRARARVTVLIGETAPENMTGPIRTSDPTHIILIDSADFKKKPGFVRLVRAEEATGACFCTHQIPLQIMADYLTLTTKAEVLIIGIQAAHLGFGSALSPLVGKAARGVAAALKSILFS
jgi:hydrogenase 3 maturation protease